MELVKYVPYLDSDDWHVEHFVYGLNSKIRSTVRMWNQALVAMEVKYALYDEDMSDAKGRS